MSNLDQLMAWQGKNGAGLHVPGAVSDRGRLVTRGSSWVQQVVCRRRRALRCCTRHRCGARSSSEMRMHVGGWRVCRQHSSVPGTGHLDRPSVAPQRPAMAVRLQNSSAQVPGYPLTTAIRQTRLAAVAAVTRLMAPMAPTVWTSCRLLSTAAMAAQLCREDHGWWEPTTVTQRKAARCRSWTSEYWAASSQTPGQRRRS